MKNFVLIRRTLILKLWAGGLQVFTFSFQRSWLMPQLNAFLLQWATPLLKHVSSICSLLELKLKLRFFTLHFHRNLMFTLLVSLNLDSQLILNKIKFLLLLPHLLFILGNNFFTSFQIFFQLNYKLFQLRTFLNKMLSLFSTIWKLSLNMTKLYLQSTHLSF